ncbi:sugar phosphate isomerase/epimerase family protein [Pseudoclavibacter terrae]|uniref:Sugar phosphate isomerase/epimerase n=1 Tax=Pseudoclavibacter terrae TaxID=1530195 RepID=A0A7J5AZ48_9MICO|nr:sugar phosphate isomerase/epimerase family protein [Pseudoclavibacter terrae]KAB1636827.1 sugar phosphate isomerase/epimerase [Pseudoclavibacter terrae]
MNPHPRLSINQATIKHASLREAIDATVRQGVQSIGLWREPVAKAGLAESARMLADSGLRFSSHCRGGFATMPEGPERRAALDDNRRAIDETATLAAAGADGSSASLIIVAGGIPEGSRDLVGARGRLEEAIAELAPEAHAAGVTLVLEPLHPMYASDRAVLSTLKQALDLADRVGSPAVGVVVDSFHVWWDPDAEEQIARAGRDRRIASYQVCDWATPLPADVLLSRHLPGAGVIDFARLTTWVNDAGYTGDVEVEVFNAELWAKGFDEAVADTVTAFGEHVSTHLAVPVHG